MTRSGAFCPRCGKTIERRASVPEQTARDTSLCDSCYLEEYDLIDAPERIQVSVCSQCGAVHRGNRWVDVGASDYTDIAIEAVTEELTVHVDATDISWEVAPEQVDPTTIRMHCTFSGSLRDKSLHEEITVPVKLSYETCERCGRIAGGSYASTVQVRARDRDPTEEETERATELAHKQVEQLEASGDRDAFVTEVNDVQGGIDIRLSTNRLGEQVARRITQEFGGYYRDYETLVTEDSDGNPVYRVAFAVHLPPYRAGEIIDPKDSDEPVLVRSTRGNLKGTCLVSGETYESAYEDGDAPEARRLGWEDEIEETTLVAIEDENAVLVLDPETYETKTIARPAYLDSEAETVAVLRSGGELYIVPENGENQ